MLVEPVELPDGSAFLTIARTLEGPQGAFSERPRRTALLLGCALEAGADTVYGASLSKAGNTEIGPACRLCERQGCITRAADHAVPLPAYLGRLRRENAPQVAAFIGPEGDFSAGEVAALLAAGVQPVTFGPVVFRVETAALFILSSLQYAWL